MGPVPVGAHAPQCGGHVEKRASKVPPRIAIGDSQVGHWTPLYVDPFRVPWFRDPEGCRTSLHGEHVVASSVLPHRQQDECMRELHQELSRCMARAGLQSEIRSARPSLRSQRCSCGHSTSQMWSPLPGSWGAESAKWLREDTSARQLASRRWCSCSRGRNRLRQCQSPSPSHPSWCKSPSPSPPGSCPADEWLSCSMEHLHLQLRPHESRRRAQWDDAPIEERPPRREQVRFNVDEELGDNPMLALDLFLIIVGGVATEQYDAPSSSTPMSMDSPWPTHSESLQSQPAYTGGAWPKVPAKPSTGWTQLRSQSRSKEGSDPVNYP